MGLVGNQRKRVDFQFTERSDQMNRDTQGRIGSRIGTGPPSEQGRDVECAVA